MNRLITLLLLLSYQIVSAQSPYVYNAIDICRLGCINGSPSNITSIGGKLYFGAYQNGSAKRELYGSNGTLAGTYIIKDINSGNGCNPGPFLSYNGKVIFSAENATTGAELWITDGTGTGTHIIADIEPGLGSSNPGNFIEYNGKVYFNASTWLYGSELWVTDGTDTGTHMVKDLAPGRDGSYPSMPFIYNGKMYFSAADINNNNELCTSDGTDTGTYMMMPIMSGISGSWPHSFLTLNGKLFFIAHDQWGDEIWYTDGISTNIFQLKDINPGTVSSYPTISSAGIIGNKLYFTADDGRNGMELWVTNGTTSGTRMVKDIYPGPNDGMKKFTTVITYKGKIYFKGCDSLNGCELWVSDGNFSGTKMVADITPGIGSSDIWNMYVYKDRLIFAAKISNTFQLMSYDGIAVKNISPPGMLANSHMTTGFTEHGDKLFFGGDFTYIGTELWSIQEATVTTVSETQLQHSFSIYPNPANGNFTIELQDTDFKNASITVYNLLGASVYQSPITNGKSQITLNQPTGIYMVKLQVDDTVLTKQLVVE